MSTSVGPFHDPYWARRDREARRRKIAKRWLAIVAVLAFATACAWSC